MSIADVAVASLYGGFDKFDACRNYAESIKTLIDKDDDQVEYHPGDGLFAAPHYYSKNENIEAELDQAIELIEEARLKVQNCLAAV
jgi:hypothetical protein